MDYVGLSALFNKGDYDICTLPSNIGPILYNNAELKNRYEVISVNNLGVLYVMTNDASVSTLDDLRGRTVYSYGEGGTPEYTIEALLAKNGLDGTFNLEFKSSPLEVLNMMQQQDGCVAILPQPPFPGNPGQPAVHPHRPDGGVGPRVRRHGQPGRHHHHHRQPPVFGGARAGRGGVSEHGRPVR